MFAFLTLSLAALQAVPAAPPAAKDDEAIVVTATKPKPDPDKEIVPLGSRISREHDGEGFQSIASNTGFQGLVSNGSANFDGTGGSVPTWRRKIVTGCKASDQRIRSKVACDLLPVEKAVAKADFASADAKLDALILPPDANSAERYAVGYYRYAVAAHFSNDNARDEALRQIVATGELSPADVAAAHKTRASLALKRGDDADAILAYQQLLANAPPEPQVQANLAALLDRQGQTSIAVRHMKAAVNLVRAQGKSPPDDWVRFLIERP